jgi:crossover junction endodeoxyribonuclease RuvC
MIVLGIDPGTATTGFGVLRMEGSRVKPVDVGVVLTHTNEAMPQRLLSLYDGLNTLMDKYKPDTVGLEKLFFGRNITNAIPVARAVGIIYLAIAQRGLHWAEYTPMQVKLAVTGTGGAEKHQVQYMVTRLLGLHEVPKPDDAADALAVAVCHAHSFRLGSMGA